MTGVSSAHKAIYTVDGNQAECSTSHYQGLWIGTGRIRHRRRCDGNRECLNRSTSCEGPTALAQWIGDSLIVSNIWMPWVDSIWITLRNRLPRQIWININFFNDTQIVI